MSGTTKQINVYSTNKIWWSNRIAERLQILPQHPIYCPTNKINLFPINHPSAKIQLLPTVFTFRRYCNLTSVRCIVVCLDQIHDTQVNSLQAHLECSFYEILCCVCSPLCWSSPGSDVRVCFEHKAERVALLLRRNIANILIPHQPYYMFRL